MTTRRRAVRFLGRSRAPRRKVSWENLAFDFAHTAAADISLAVLTPEPMQTTHVGVGTATLQRMIANFEYTFSGGNTSTSNQKIFVGVGVVTRDARLAGIVPSPLNSFNQDWYYGTGRVFKKEVMGAPENFTWEVDIRTRRRLRGGYDLVLVVENPINTDVTILTTAMRLLWSQEA